MSQLSWKSQIENRNFLSPTGFQFILSKKPKISFFCDSVNIPGINLGVAMQPSYFKQIPIPGEILTYDDLTITFNIDEDMENFLEVYNWMIQFGFPKNAEQYQSLLDEDPINQGKQTAISGMSDASLIIYNSNYNPNIQINFKDLFPVSLSPVQFQSKVDDIIYLTATATFKYTIFDIVRIKN
jgi:hypothetical protein